MTISELRALVNSLKERGDELRAAHNAYHGVDAIVNGRMEQLLDDGLKFFPAHHIAESRRQVEDEERPKAEARAGVRRYHAQRALAEVGEALRAFKAEARRAPDVENCWLRRSKESGISADRFWQILQFTATQRTNLRIESASWSVTRWRDEYQRALEDATHPINAVLIAVVEDVHGDGYTGALDGTAEAITSAHAFKTLIDETRAARVPADVAEFEAIHTSVRKLDQAANDSGIRPRNTTIDPRAATAMAAAS
jgi:hypothetical protein